MKTETTSENNNTKPEAEKRVMRPGWFSRPGISEKRVDGLACVFDSMKNTWIWRLAPAVVPAPLPPWGSQPSSHPMDMDLHGEADTEPLAQERAEEALHGTQAVIARLLGAEFFARFSGAYRVEAHSPVIPPGARTARNGTSGTHEDASHEANSETAVVDNGWLEEDGVWKKTRGEVSGVVYNAVAGSRLGLETWEGMPWGWRVDELRHGRVASAFAYSESEAKSCADECIADEVARRAEIEAARLSCRLILRSAQARTAETAETTDKANDQDGRGAQEEWKQEHGVWTKTAFDSFQFEMVGTVQHELVGTVPMSVPMSPGGPRPWVWRVCRVGGTGVARGRAASEAEAKDWADHALATTEFGGRGA